MTIEAKILADNRNTSGNRITSFLLRYPRFIHADFMTHRLFSRNTSSSRARPVAQLIAEAELEPAMPIYWGKNQKGMQAERELDQEELIKAKGHWHNARSAAIREAKALNEIGMHKQYVNRLLEPFTHITVICTATHFGNFFNLRAHKDAMPEIQDLAYKMLTLYSSNEPKLLQPEEWHLPFADQYLNDGLELSSLLKIVTARAARVSYLNYEGNISHDKDYDLHDRLIEGGHWSPFEHAAMALSGPIPCGNFVGFKQYRKFFTQEHRIHFNAEQLFQQRGKQYEK
jgi:thymidylate synthase ThyX